MTIVLSCTAISFGIGLAGPNFDAPGQLRPWTQAGRPEMLKLMFPYFESDRMWSSRWSLYRSFSSQQLDRRTSNINTDV